MKFLLDESVDSRLADYLTAKGYNVTAIARDYPNALPDEEVLSIAWKERRILIANDRDFGELIFRRGFRHKGVVYFRLRSTALSIIETRMQYVLDNYNKRLSEFLVVTDSRVRPRKALVKSSIIP